ncbi:MAG: energy transducer TonB [Acidobacteriota bacterium]
MPPPAPGAAALTGAAPAYVPPPDHRARHRILGAIGLVVLIIGAFAVGTWLHGSDSSAKATQSAPATASAHTDTSPAPSRNDITIVPATEGAIAERPITTAPSTSTANGVPGEYQRNDATAATSEEYAQMAARVKAERKAVVGGDPRTVKGDVYGSAPTTPSHPREAQRSTQTAEPVSRAPRSTQGVTIPMNGSEPKQARPVVRTRPIPISQPIPSIRVTRNATARLDLTIGADGSVRDVTIIEPIPGETAKLIAAIQTWRFKPGTENGVPTTSHFSVDISFHGHE